MFIGLIMFFVILTVTIGIHEYGHYLAMIRNGVRVVRFQIGFGPTLKEWTLKNGTIFSINLVPLGGMAQPVAEGPDSMETASRWARFKIYVAGMVMNCLLAMVVLLVMWYGFGAFPRPPDGAVPFIAWAPTWLRIPVAAFVASFGMWVATPVVIWDLITTAMHASGEGAAVMGPIGIAHVATQVAQSATSVSDLIVKALWFLSLINVAIAQMNLLPIPGLDGGHIAMLPFERMLSKETRTRIILGGFLVVLGIVVVATYGDIARLL